MTPRTMLLAAGAALGVALSAAPASAQLCGEAYTVRAGDTLSGLARRVFAERARLAEVAVRAGDREAQVRADARVVRGGAVRRAELLDRLAHAVVRQGLQAAFEAATGLVVEQLPGLLPRGFVYFDFAVHRRSSSDRIVVPDSQPGPGDLSD